MAYLLGMISLGAHEVWLSSLLALSLGAVIFMESFDAYGTTVALIAKFWTIVTTAASALVAGRVNGNALQFVNTGYMRKTLPSNMTRLLGHVAFRYTALPTQDNTFISFEDAGTIQCHLCLSATGFLVVRKGAAFTSAVLGTGTTQLISNIWYSLEFDVTFSSAGSGAFLLKINNVTELNLAAVDTAAGTANDYCNQFALRNGAFGLTNSIDDLMLLDTTGGAPRNTLPGPTHLTALFPNAAGSAAQWAVTGGANAQTVLASNPPDVTKYISDNVSGHETTVNIDNLAAGSGTVLCAQLRSSAQNPVVGSATYKNKILDGGVERLGAAIAPGTTDADSADIFPTANDGTEWDITKINATEIGTKVP